MYTDLFTPESLAELKTAFVTQFPMALWETFYVTALSTALAVVLSGYMTDPVLNSLSMVGNILIFCVGVNLIWPKTIKVANLLPALIVAVLMA